MLTAATLSRACRRELLVYHKLMSLPHHSHPYTQTQTHTPFIYKPQTLVHILICTACVLCLYVLPMKRGRQFVLSTTEPSRKRPSRLRAPSRIACVRLLIHQYVWLLLGLERVNFIIKTTLNLHISVPSSV